MKKLFRRIASFFVVAYANHVYRDRVRLADKFHKQLKWRMYVCIPFDGKTLIVMDRKGFRHAKRLRHINDPTMSTVKLMDGSFYYTGDRDENGAMSPKEKELRRLAFVRYMLRRAKLPGA